MKMQKLVVLAGLCAIANAHGQHSFEYYHPDISGREAGLAALDRRDFETALSELKRSARFADKGSQALLAEMHWSGQGVGRDPCVAYIWADIAAERGYPTLIAIRERYWNALSASERECVSEKGADILAEYGDDTAKPRLEALLRKGAKQGTGSRVGVGISGTMVFTDVHSASMGGGVLRIDGKKISNYYQPKRWEPDVYWGAQDRAWHHATPLPTGSVSVGPIGTGAKDDNEPGREKE